MGLLYLLYFSVDQMLSTRIFELTKYLITLFLIYLLTCNYVTCTLWTRQEDNYRGVQVHSFLAWTLNGTRGQFRTQFLYPRGERDLGTH